MGGAGPSLVDLEVPGAPLCHTVHARDPRAGEQVYLVDLASAADILDESAFGDGGNPSPAVGRSAKGG